MALYLKHFGLKREPFSIVPDPGFLYPSDQHRQAIAHLKYGLDREGGFILLSGEVGTGKTTLTRTLLKAIPAHIRVAYVLNSKLEVGDLLASICHELAIDLTEVRGLSFDKACVDALYHDLLQVHAEGKKTLVVIEEAQNLSTDVLETLRLLSNLETHTEKLLHILLVGQPELLEILAQRELRQLNQRVVARFHLQPLERDDMAKYINHRLHRAGAQRAIFDSDCLAVLYRLTEGVPRLINLVCQHSLLAAYATGSARVSGSLLKRAAGEILPPQSTSSKSSGRRRGALASGLILLGIVTGLGLAGGPPDFNAGLQRLRSLVTAETGTSRLKTTGTITVSGTIDGMNQELLAAPTQVSSASSLEFPVPLASQLKPQRLPDGSLERTTLDSLLVAQIAGTVPSAPLDTPSQQGPRHAAIGDELIAPPAHDAMFAADAALLKLWLAPALQPLHQSFEAALEAARLRLDTRDNLDLERLLAINRPGVVELQRPSGRELLLLRGTSKKMLRLEGRGGLEYLSHDDFTEAWTGGYRYLWKPPEGYSVLREGLANRQFIDWLQARMARLDGGYERVISGGRYGAAIRAKVTAFQQRHGLRADGVLGQETTMMISRLTDTSIPLLRSEDG